MEAPQVHHPQKAKRTPNLVAMSLNVNKSEYKGNILN